MTKENNPLGMKTLAEMSTTPLHQQLGENYRQLFQWDWIFSKWYEKIILLLCLGYGGWNFFSWIFGVIF